MLLLLMLLLPVMTKVMIMVMILSSEEDVLWGWYRLWYWGANTVCSQDIWVLLGDNVMVDINSLIWRWAACYDDVEWLTRNKWCVSSRMLWQQTAKRLEVTFSDWYRLGGGGIVEDQNLKFLNCPWVSWSEWFLWFHLTALMTHFPAVKRDWKSTLQLG